MENIPLPKAAELLQSITKNDFTKIRQVFLIFWGLRSSAMKIGHFGQNGKGPPFVFFEYYSKNFDLAAQVD